MFKVTTLPFDETPRTEEGAVDFSKDFFGKASNLTVSGQLEGELGATAFGDIYTSVHLVRNSTQDTGEFWMIEPEMALMI